MPWLQVGCPTLACPNRSPALQHILSGAPWDALVAGGTPCSLMPQQHSCPWVVFCTCRASLSTKPPCSGPGPIFCTLRLCPSTPVFHVAIEAGVVFFAVLYTKHACPWSVFCFLRVKLTNSTCLGCTAFHLTIQPGLCPFQCSLSRHSQQLDAQSTKPSPALCNKSWTVQTTSLSNPNVSGSQDLS